MQAGQCAQAPWLKFVMRLGKQSWWLSLFLWLVAAAPARADLEMRVAIEQGEDQVVVGSSTPAVIKDGSGQVLAQMPAQGAMTAEAEAGGVAIDRWQAGQVWIEPSDNGYVFIGADTATGKWYRGRTLVVPTSGGLTAVNYVDLEHYLYSVVGAEMPVSWAPEALKAQAVAARSYALFQRQSSANTVFDVGDTTTWQVYGGVNKEASSTISAVEATRGQVLTYNGQIIQAVFHSSSGGYTENVEDVWTQPLPYLRAVQDFDQDAPVYQWAVDFSADQLRQLIPGVGNILSFQPAETTPRGRIVSMRVVGDAGERTLSGSELRQALDLKSTLFTVIPEMGQVASTGNISTAPVAFQVSGRGFGHGLGMSQYGAYGLARQGYTYQQILAHYYTGTTLARIQVR
jgi:stage II sporulation protein D